MRYSKARALDSPPERSLAQILRYNFAFLMIALLGLELRFQYLAPKTPAPVGAPVANCTTKKEEPKIPCDPKIIYRGPAGLPALRQRSDLGRLLQARKFTIGAEVGVQNALHAQELLGKWHNVQHFYLIDLWGFQENYEDIANRPPNEQDQIYANAQTNLMPWTQQNKTTFLRMLSTQAAQKIPHQSLDFVYIDARHDYCGAKEDMEAYYPKLRPGGIMAGHDFLSVQEQKGLDHNQDWSKCMDGSSNPGAVKGAVEHFCVKNGLSFSVMYAEGAIWASWMLQKPTRMECVQEMGGYGSDIVGYE